MDNEIDAQENHEGGNESIVGNVIDDKRAKRKEQDANNANSILVAANGLKNVGGVPGAIATGVLAAHKWSGGRSTKHLGRVTTTANKFMGPAGRKAQKINDNLGKATNSRKGQIAQMAMNKGMNNSGNKGGTNTGTSNNETTAASSSSGDGKSTSSVVSDDKANVKISKPINKFKLSAIVIVVLIVLGLFIWATIIAGLDIDPDDWDTGSSKGKGITVNNINGAGNYFTSELDGNYFNSSVVYEKENGESTTYSLNDFLIGGVYSLTEDNLSIEIYKFYAIMLRTNVISDDDGVIEEKDYKYANATSSPSYETIKQAVEETMYELLLDSNNNVIKTDFSNNDCEECTIDDGVNLKSIKELVSTNNYDYKNIASELYGEKYIISTINFSTMNNEISLELKDTTKATYLNKPIAEFLSSHGSSLEDLNSYISNNVNKIYGTGEGVATAAVSLINYLYDGFGIKLPYYWGGKYGYQGVNPSFGKYSPVTMTGGQIYKYISLDCSGFAQWAIINGGIKDPGTGTINYAQIFKNRCNITESNCIGQVGDLINYRTTDNNRGHVQVIVSVDRLNNSYYIAESSVNGVVVTTRAMHKGRDDAVVYVLHMSDYYRNNVRDKG